MTSALVPEGSEVIVPNTRATVRDHHPSSACISGGSSLAIAGTGTVAAVARSIWSGAISFGQRGTSRNPDLTVIAELRRKAPALGGRRYCRWSCGQCSLSSGCGGSCLTTVDSWARLSTVSRNTTASFGVAQSLRDYIDARGPVAEHGNTSEYQRDLIRRDQQQQAARPLREADHRRSRVRPGGTADQASDRRAAQQALLEPVVTGRTTPSRRGRPRRTKPATTSPKLARMSPTGFDEAMLSVAPASAPADARRRLPTSRRGGSHPRAQARPVEGFGCGRGLSEFRCN